MQEIVVISLHMGNDAVRAGMETSLPTDKETKLWPDAWQRLTTRGPNGRRTRTGTTACQTA